jgi:hypothetical protein
LSDVFKIPVAIIAEPVFAFLTTSSYPIVEPSLATICKFKIVEPSLISINEILPPFLVDLIQP